MEEESIYASIICRSLADSDRVWPPDLDRVATAWPYLEPHIRAAILTPIDGSLANQQRLEGGEQP